MLRTLLNLYISTQNIPGERKLGYLTISPLYGKLLRELIAQAYSDCEKEEQSEFRTSQCCLYNLFYKYK